MSDGEWKALWSWRMAYESLNKVPIDGEWKALWSWKGPHRIQTCMWMAAHERLLTNYCKSKRVSEYLPHALDVIKTTKPLFMFCGIAL
jgi:hypothetical protein